MASTLTRELRVYNELQLGPTRCPEFTTSYDSDQLVGYELTTSYNLDQLDVPS